MESWNEWKREADNLAQQDKVYCKLLCQLREAEKKLNMVERKLANEDRDIIWDFYDLIESMNNRLLELIFEEQKRK